MAMLIPHSPVYLLTGQHPNTSERPATFFWVPAHAWFAVDDGERALAKRAAQGHRVAILQSG